MSWISESATSGAKLRKQYKMNDIEIFIKDPLPDIIDVDFVLKYVASMLPAHLMTEVDIIYIGEFENLKSRSVNAIFEDGAIFITNEQVSEMDLIDDIVHEVAHSIEKKYVDIIYGDKMIEKEFRAKRRKLYDILKEKGKNPPPEMLTNISYSPTLDNYFYSVVTYPVLDQICTFANLFVGPYSVTSVREYFAQAFDQYFLGEEMLVRNFSPVLYRKIQELVNLEDQ